MQSKATLCWKCANACGGCSWSDTTFTPVEGWTAIKTTLNGADAELLERAADKIQELVADLGDADAMTEYWMKKNQWIKCSERLPEPRYAREWYLVALESGCVKTLAFEKAENRWHETGSPVTHWMPLPDAPEVEG